MSYWRDTARPIIAAAIQEAAGDQERLKQLLFDAYPFRERRYHPYKIWLDEIRVQTGKKPIADRPRRCAPKVDAASMDLFEEGRP